MFSAVGVAGSTDGANLFCAQHARDDICKGHTPLPALGADSSRDDGLRCMEVGPEGTGDTLSVSSLDAAVQPVLRKTQGTQCIQSTI